MKLLSFVVSHQGGFLEDNILFFGFIQTVFLETVHGNVTNDFFFNFRRFLFFSLISLTLIFSTCWR